MCIVLMEFELIQNENCFDVINELKMKIIYLLKPFVVKFEWYLLKKNK